MGNTFVRGLALSAAVLLVLGSVACASSGGSRPDPEATQDQADASPRPTDTVSGADGESADARDVPWPAAMTLPKPTGMSIDHIENHYACDGTLLAVLVSTVGVEEQMARAYLEGVQDLFGITADVRAGTGEGSLNDDNGGLRAEGRLQDQPSAADATKVLNWKTYEDGYQFDLQETARPGIPIEVPNTPPSIWVEFPHPDAEWEYCDARESSGYREGTGFTPPSTTWTLQGSPVMQPQVQAWMEGLAAAGWSVKENPAMAGAGMPEAVLTSEEYTLHYAMSGSYLTLWMSDRNFDKFFGN